MIPLVCRAGSPLIASSESAKLAIPLRSMTGYARVESASSGANLVWILRSLNGRFREIQLRVPPIFEPSVSLFRTMVSSHPVRGRLEAELQMDSVDRERLNAQINWSRIAGIRAWIDSIRKGWDVNVTLDPLALLQWPGVLLRNDREVDLEMHVHRAQELLRMALADLERTQAEEGGRLTSGLVSRLENIVGIASRVRLRMDSIQVEQLQRLQRRMASARLELDPARLEQELVLLTQKMDVSEELDRMESHLTALADVLKTGAGGGRKLDFLLQEIQREVNTLSAKIQNAEISQQMVDLKVIIEQMREQAQNIG